LRFDRNPAGMVVTTADGSVLDANEAFARLLGYSSREEILALNAAGFYADPSAYERIVARLQTGEAVTDLEAELRRCNGDLAWVLMSSYLVRDRRGTRFETTVIDVTDRRRAAEAERRAEALRSVTGLANAAAHEINNPLFIIMANLELLEKEGPASPKVRERIQNVLEAIRRVHEIVERMRRIIRLELAADPSGLPEMLDLGKSAAPDPNA
jgi:PAS domain S-box-containing protein